MSKPNTKTRRSPPKIDPPPRRWHVEDEPRLKPYYTVRSTHHLWTGAGWVTLSLTYGDLATKPLSESAQEQVKDLENGQKRSSS